MKEWFKYKYGFVNIDENGVYFTKSGNWSETKQLKEKNYKGLKTSDLKSKIKVYTYLSVVAILLILAILMNIVKGDGSFLLLIGAPVLFYFTYNYLIREVGASFFIPVEKIKQLELIEGHVTFIFLDFNDKESSHTIKELDQKGFEIVERLKLMALK